MQQVAEKTETSEGIRADVEIWRDGINLLLRSFDPLQGREYKNPEQERALVAFLAHALNTEICGFHLASSGFYSQALVLARICAEDWLAWWYVKAFPSEAGRFLDYEQKAPTWNDMLQKLEAYRGEGVDEAARAWIRRLHRRAHVDSISVGLSWHTLVAPGMLGIGPSFDPDKFAACASDFATVLPQLLEPSEVMGLLGGVNLVEPGVYKRYSERLIAWLKTKMEHASC
jgi:hypothetical protein